MRYSIIIAILLYSTTSFAEDPQLSADKKLADLLFPSESSVQLEQFPVLTEAEFNPIKDKVFKQLDSDACHIISTSDTPHEFFRKYDLSGAGVDDVILSSYCAAMEYRNFIWFRKGNSLKYAGFMLGTPLKYYRPSKSEPYSIVVSEGWCCAGFVGKISLYKLKENRGLYKYKLEKRVMEWGGITIPDKRIAPVKFKIKSEKYALRDSPEIRNEPIDDIPGGKKQIGNIIAEFPRGSQGEAIAADKDKTGQIWWFVLMDKDSKTITTLFYADNGAYKAGWMRQQDLEIAK